MSKAWSHGLISPSRCFGYQSHISIDRGFGFIRAWAATDAAAYEGKLLREGLLDKTKVDSSGRRNTASVSGSKELVQSLGRCPPTKGLSRPAVEGDRHGRKIVRAVRAEVGALWKVLAQQPIGVLVRAALPGAVGIAEVDRHASLDP